MRRVIAAIALVALASTPVVARTRLFCRYTGEEITDCAERQIPGRSVVQVKGCCNQQVTRTLGNLLTTQQLEVAPPALIALPLPLPLDLLGLQTPDRHIFTAAAPTGPPVFLITRALLI